MKKYIVPVCYAVFITFMLLLVDSILVGHGI